LDIGTGQWSVGAWIKTTSTSTYNPIIAKGAGGDYSYVFYTDANGKINNRLYVNNGSVYASALGNKTVNDNQWHYVVGTWNPTGTVTSVYVDGVLDSTTTTTSGTLDSNSAGAFI